MCVICISPKGTDKYSDFFIKAVRTAASRNKDGFGFAFKKANTGAVFTQKGFFNIDNLLDEVRDHKLKKDDELIIHLRMRSAGVINGESTHPFELNLDSPNNISYATHGRTTIHPLFFHNGTITEFTDHTKSTSDTYNFANKVLKSKAIWSFLVNDTEKFVQSFKSIISFNKFAFMSKQTETILIGNWEEDQGYQFSNTGYKEYGRSSTYVEPVIINKKEEPIHSLNTNIIQPNETNFDRFIVKSHCRSNVGSVIEKDTYFYIRRFASKTGVVMLEERDTQGSYKFIDTDTLKSVFILIPKPEYSKRYMDYIKLVGKIKVTKSAIKKIYNKVLNITGNKKERQPEGIDIKYNDSVVRYDYNAILMFLHDHKQMVDPYKIDALLALSEPVKPENDMYINNMCEC